jgi:hypothetical protein
VAARHAAAKITKSGKKLEKRQEWAVLNGSDNTFSSPILPSTRAHDSMMTKTEQNGIPLVNIVYT